MKSKQKLKFVSFDDDKNISSTGKNMDNNVTIKKYQNKINNVNNDKIKKSLIELAKVFKQR